MDQSNRIVVPEPAIGWRKRAGQVSLPEVHRSIVVPITASFWRKLLAFSGPGFLVAVGYMDPGNWATSLAGGSKFGYALLTIALLSNLMAILLQALCARLGIATGRDLAQACRDAFPRAVSWPLWVLTEVAICSTDLAEVIGTAIGLSLLFGIPLEIGVVITALDVFLILLLQNLGFRWVEAFIVTLLGVIACQPAPELAPVAASRTGDAPPTVGKATREGLAVAELRRPELAAGFDERGGGTRVLPDLLAQRLVERRGPLGIVLRREPGELLLEPRGDLAAHLLRGGGREERRREAHGEDRLTEAHGGNPPAARSRRARGCGACRKEA